MYLTTKQLRKLLNNAWDARDKRPNIISWWATQSGKKNMRGRDVSKILREAMPKPQAWDNLIEEEKP